MSRLFFRCVVVIACLAGSLSARAGVDGGPALAPGKPAPALHVKEWIRGDAVAELKPGMSYVVEFWGNWCEASGRSLPKLQLLQQKYADDLKVIVVSVSEHGNSSAAKTRALVEGEGRALNFAIGADARRRTVRAWMDAAEQRSIPTAFVVDRRGIVTWIGNPLWPAGEFEEAVEKTVADKFDETARTVAKERWKKLRERVLELETAISQELRIGEVERAADLLDKLRAVNPAGEADYVKFEIDTLLDAGQNPARAYAEARKALTGALKDDAETLSGIAWKILNDDGIEPRDKDLAYDLAARAVELTGEKDSETLATFASACASRGQFGKAIELQTRAIQLEPDADIREQFSQWLKEYREKRASRHTGQPE